MSHQLKIIELINQDPTRLKALSCVKRLNLPQCYLAAGFVRNLVWDYLHSKSENTHLNDVDVVYFNENETQADMYKEYEYQLTQLMPELNWQVRNQAVMHIRNEDNPYKSTLDAMSYWPEKETALAVRKLDDNEFECITAFGFESLFNFCITHNPKRKKYVFEHRISSKGWLNIWPNLTVVL